MKRNIVYGVLLLSFFAALPWLLERVAYDDDNELVATIVHLDSSSLSRLSSKKFINEPLQPVVKPRNLNSDKVALGRHLFSDKRLSPDGTVACDSCHPLNGSGVDQLSHPVGGDVSRGLVNTLTIYNSANNFRWYWDGRAATLAEQVNESLTNVTEMGAEWEVVLSTLGSVPEYQAAFAQLYPANGIQIANVIDVIAEFERSLVTPNAPFDRYLLGDADALTSEEKNGYYLFKTYGCIACHQGGNVGGNMFQLFGVMGDYFAGREALVEIDLGRFNVTGKDDDKHRFRVPSLRNVALTAPYFHDGSAETLEQAVMVMASYQLGRPIPVDDVHLIVQFLRSLSAHDDEAP